MTTLISLTGKVVSPAALLLDFGRTPTIIMAQAVTVVGAPLAAIVFLWLANRKDMMGDQVNGPVTQVVQPYRETMASEQR